MSTKMRGLLCEEVLIWEPLDLSDGELSNESQYDYTVLFNKNKI